MNRFRCCLSSYVIAILLGHVEVVFPYISDSGVRIPESCIFSQLFNIVAFLLSIIVLVRYKQVEQQCRDYLAPDVSKVFTLNKISLWFGLIASAGVSIIANFQELQLWTIHMMGGSLAFGFGTLYCILQTRISYSMFPMVKSGLILARCRLALTIILAICSIISTVFGTISIYYFKGKDITVWKPTDGGYLYHLISTICEWVAALSFDFYILSYAHEFKYMSISSPKFYMISTANYLREEQQSEDSNYNVVNVVINNRDNIQSNSTIATASQRRQIDTD